MYHPKVPRLLQGLDIDLEQPPQPTLLLGTLQCLVRFLPQAILHQIPVVHLKASALRFQPSSRWTKLNQQQAFKFDSQMELGWLLV